MNAMLRRYSRDRLLFILKSREASWGGYSYSPSSGLFNSVRFLVEMLTGLGVDASMVEVMDNSGIDREVSRVRPTHVIIEAFWVVPDKFDELMPLHPDVRWIVRNHSEVPFLANEGIAFGWIAAYLRRGIEIMCNAPRAVEDIRALAMGLGLSDRMVTYGPNHYPVHAAGAVTRRQAMPDVFDVSCFGAIRPLKNHVVQALAAICFARTLGTRLRFHVNGTRIEGHGDPILKNLRGLFGGEGRFELVEHEWMPHDKFLAVSGMMDIALQVSFSETFNIVAADAVCMNVPVVVSPEIAWLGGYARANPTSVCSITDAMLAIVAQRDPVHRLHRQRRDLAAYCAATEAVWMERFQPVRG
jgi:hypothetical protein